MDERAYSSALTNSAAQTYPTPPLLPLSQKIPIMPLGHISSAARQAFPALSIRADRGISYSVEARCSASRLWITVYNISSGSCFGRGFGCHIRICSVHTLYSKNHHFQGRIQKYSWKTTWGLRRIRGCVIAEVNIFLSQPFILRHSAGWHDMTSPVAPVAPVAPGAPAGPVLPGRPVGPVAPVLPWMPCGPVAPVAPGEPAGPAGPVTPWSPCGPSEAYSRRTVPSTFRFTATNDFSETQHTRRVSFFGYT